MPSTYADSVSGMRAWWGVEGVTITTSQIDATGDWFHDCLDAIVPGETPRDCYDADSGNGGYTTPRRCVADVKCVIDWMTRRHHDREVALAPEATNPASEGDRPALLGWSQGALVAQMYAQRHGPATLSDLVLYGTIFDPDVAHPRRPLYDPSGQLIRKPPPPEAANTAAAALEDFTVPGSVDAGAATAFARLALAADPVKAAWEELHEFDGLEPARLRVPTLVVAGARDPYVRPGAQLELFARLGSEDKAMCVLPDCDHPAHILKNRNMFVRAVTGFLSRKS